MHSSHALGHSHRMRAQHVLMRSGTTTVGAVGGPHSCINFLSSEIASGRCEICVPSNFLHAAATRIVRPHAIVRSSQAPFPAAP